MLGATGSVKINAAKTVNKTLEADGKQYDDREKTVPTDVEDKLSGNSAAENNPLNQDKLLEIGSLKVSSKIYKLNNDPSAKYLIETNKKYADYLNKLGEIFDKTKVQEKQEFAGMFQEIAHNYLGDLTGKISKEEKAFLNSFVDGLIAQWTSGDFLAGASGTALLESMQSAISEIKDPALKQIAAGMIGALAGEFVGGDAQAGASSAVSTGKYNWLKHEEQEKLVNELRSAKDNVEKFAIISKWYGVSQQNRNENPEVAEAIEQMFVDELLKLKKFDYAGVSFNVDFDANAGLHNNLARAKEFLSLSSALGKYIPQNTVCDFVQMSAEDIIQKAYSLGNAKIQVVDTALNITRNYEGDTFNKEFGKMVAREIGKGTMIYGLHFTEQKLGVPKSMILVGDIVIIFGTNIVW